MSGEVRLLEEKAKSTEDKYLAEQREWKAQKEKL